MSKEYIVTQCTSISTTHLTNIHQSFISQSGGQEHDSQSELMLICVCRICQHNRYIHIKKWWNIIF